MQIVLDTETTGLRAGEDELLQVSILEAASGRTLLDAYVRPTRATSWEQAQAVNGISPEMVANAPRIEELLPTLNQILQQTETVIGYNTNFDLSFLRAAGVELPETLGIVDVMADFAPIYGEWSEKYGAYRWQKLSTCAAYYKYDWGSDAAHNSLADCRATLHCWRRMQADGRKQDAGQRPNGQQQTASQQTISQQAAPKQADQQPQKPHRQNPHRHRGMER